MIEYLYIALVAHEVNSTEIDDLDFSIMDSDNMPIDDIKMILQWKSDSNFKVIIDLKLTRKNVDLVAEVCVYDIVDCFLLVFFLLVQQRIDCSRLFVFLEPQKFHD